TADPRRLEERGPARVPEPGLRDRPRDDRHRRHRDVSLCPAATSGGEVAAMSTATSRRRKQRVLRIVVLVVVGAFFVIPLWSMFKFSIQDPTGVGTWSAW